MPVTNPAPIIIDDEGVQKGLVREVDFVGAGVTASVSGNKATVTIAGGAGAAWTTLEVDMGTTPVFRGSFTISDAAIGVSSKIIIMHAPGPYTGKGTRADEAEMDPILVTAAPTGAGTAEARWATERPWYRPGQNTVQEVFNAGGIFLTLFRQTVNVPTRLGYVKGKIKFFYTVG